MTDDTTSQTPPAGPDGRREFGPYRLGALLGRGGMGEVYRAYDTVRDREVALKLLNAQLAEDQTYQERFRRESQTAARLGEPHIIPIHDFGEIDGTLYLDMRLVEGHDLRALLKRDGPMAPTDAVAIVEQVAAALDAAHAAGLVHRDVKPENILVTPTGFAYLVDFGIAHHAGDPHLTKTGTAVGSIAYMAPEQLDNVPVNAVSDVYSLAAVLFELLTGRQPYPGDSVSAVVKATVLGEVPAPSRLNPAVPQRLDGVVMRGLAKNPVERFPSAGALAAAARAGLDGAAAGPAYDQTMVGRRPGTAQYSGPVSFSGPQQQFSSPQPAPAPQQFSGPQPPPGYGAQPPGTYGGRNYPGSGDDGSGRAIHVVLGILIVLMVLALAGLAVYWFAIRDEGSQTASGSPSSTTTVTSTIPPTETIATPPPGSSPCNSGVGVAGGRTTCGFAINVRDAYLASGIKGESRTISASSPRTGRTYVMNCGAEQGIVVCRGGDAAEVHIY